MEARQRIEFVPKTEERALSSIIPDFTSLQRDVSERILSFW